MREREREREEKEGKSKQASKKARKKKKDGSLLWWRLVSLAHFRVEHSKKETVEKTLEAPGMR